VLGTARKARNIASQGNDLHFTPPRTTLHHYSRAGSPLQQSSRHVLRTIVVKPGLRMCAPGGGAPFSAENE
jgi:hypothetical protein